MEVIAIDGAEVRPTGPLDAIIVHPGERYDVRVVAFREPTRPFYYMMVGLAEQFMDQPRDNSIYGLAKLEYGGEATEQSWDGGKKADLYLGHCRIDQHCFLLGCPFRSTNESSSSISTPDGRNFVCSSGNELISTNPKYLLTDSEKDLDMEWHRIELDPEAKTVNGYRFEFPKAKRPFFVPGTNAGAQNCSTKCDGKQKPCSCFYYKSFPLNKIIQITFVNKIPSRSSPSSMVDSFRHSVSIHLHGTHFQVTRTIVPQIGNTTRTLMEANGFLDEISGDKGSPVWKDTVMVPYGGQTVIRFMAKNPGWWLAESQQNGRGAIRFAFVIGDEQQKIPMPPWGFPADCGTFDPGEDIYSEFEQKGTI